LNARGSDYVTGFAQSPDFPTTAGAFQPTFGGGNNDAFVTMVRSHGAALGYSTYLGGGQDDEGDALAVGRGGAAYVAGSTSSGSFPVTPGAFDTSINSFIFSDAFAVKLSATGGAEAYGTFLGGNDSDFAAGIAIGPHGSVSIVGTTYSTNFPTTPDALSSTLGGPADALLVRLSPDGSALLYGTFLGGTGSVIDAGYAVRTVGPSSVDVVGETHSPDFPTTPGAYDRTFNGNFDAFVVNVGGIPTGP
jgi:hypothetical protein